MLEPDLELRPSIDRSSSEFTISAYADSEDLGTPNPFIVSAPIRPLPGDAMDERSEEVLPRSSLPKQSLPQEVNSVSLFYPRSMDYSDAFAIFI